MFIKRKLEKYLKEHLEEKETSFFQAYFERSSASQEYEEDSVGGTTLFKRKDINTFIEDYKDEDTFQTKLFQFIDSKNLKDSDVYNKVNIDRRLFSKIRSNKDYHPSKETIILFGLALELDEDEIEELLKSASYSLPMNTTFDLIVRFCFKEHIYDVQKVNEFLYEYKCKLLNE